MRRRRLPSSANRRRGIGVVTVLVATGCADRPTEIRSGTVIEHVSVVDVVQARTIPDMTVVVDGQRIVAVQPASRIAFADSVVRIDGAGKYLIPGLWDMHVHALWESTAGVMLPLFVANGVTGVRDMWGDLAVSAQLRSAADSEHAVEPRWVVAGNLVDGPHPWWPESVVVADPERGRRVVDSLAAAGAAFIKVYSLLDPETYRAILARARELGLPAAGHVPFSVTAREASELGQVSFEHLFGVMEGCSGADESIRRDRADWLAARGAGQKDFPNPFFDVGIYRRVLDSFDEGTCTALLQELAERGTWQVPTLVANRFDAYLADTAAASDPRLAYLPASMTEPWLQAETAQRDQSEAERDLRLDYFRKQLEVVGLMAKLGVPILAGTDTPNPFTLPGFSLHDELGLLVEAGLSPAQALRSATYDPAVFLGATDSLGTVEPGKLADLVLLDADPLEDIANTTRIDAVFANGRLFGRWALDEMLARAKAAGG
jgi:imidazolonepropionase-like amidohydrolase